MSDFIKVIEPFTANAKRLPRHPETGSIVNVFMANGVKYYILVEDDAFPIARWGIFSKYVAQFMSGMDFQSIFNTILKIEDVHERYVKSTAKFSEAVLITQSAKDEVLTLSEMKYATAFFICSLFIVTKDEDLTKWTASLAEEKIQNWAAEGYTAPDFFAISAHYAAEYTNASNALAAQIAGALEEMTNQPPEARAAFTDAIESVTEG